MPDNQMTTLKSAPARGEPSKAPAQQEAEDPFASYKGKEMPLGSYAVLVGLYGAAFGGFLLAHKRSGKPLPERPRLSDILLLGVATHKVSRLVTKDWVTSPIRAPFTEYKETAEAGEVEEKARGEGMQLATGQLLT